MFYNFTKRRCQERGSALLLFTFLTILVVIPMIGLAIDGSIVIWQKARLASSVDAAAYAAGRSLSLGSTVSSAQAAAMATATTYFNANFQPGVMGTTAKVTPAVPPPNNGRWTISVDATAKVPLYFLRILGFSNSNLAAHAQVSRRNVNIMVVLDRSASLLIYNSGGCSSVISAAENFTNMFVGGQDNLGLITFQTTANLDFPPGVDFKTRATYLPGVSGMAQMIGQMQCSGYTNSVSALKLAYDQIVAINQAGALNVIVFFSDGKPDAITAGFKAKQLDNRDAVAYSFAFTNGVPASSCTSRSNIMNGVMVAMDENPDATASTLGVLPSPACPTCGDPINSQGLGVYGLLPTPISSASAPGCSFANPSATATLNNTNSVAWCSGAACDARNDVESIPATDVAGNNTNTSYRPLTIANYGLFPAGAYTANAVRPDTPSGVVNASLNAAFEQVKKIRADTQFKPVIYTIGLGSYIDTGFMQDVANDPSAPNPDPNSPQGQYVYAPTASQLASAFQQIASQVLRISQ